MMLTKSVRLRNLLKRYAEDTQGNFSTLFVTGLSASLLLMGAVFDIALMIKSQNRLQNLTDGAALLALRYDGDISEKEAFFVEYMNELIKTDDENPLSTKVEIVQTATSLTLSADVDVPYNFVMFEHTHGIDEVSASAEVSMGLQSVEIALVIDISSSMAGARLAEAKASAALFIDQVFQDEKLTDQVTVSIVPFGGTVRVPVGLKSLLTIPDEGLESYSTNWIGEEWNQCFELDVVDVENGIDVDGSYRVLPDFYSWNQNNPWCPLKGNEFLSLTDDVEALHAKVNTLSLSDGTGTDHGMLWGYETLNDEWANEFPDGLEDTPATNNSETKKVLVLMTDGGITAQHFVRDQDKVGTPPYNSRRRARVSYNNSLNNFYTLCDQAKAQDIEIFTIGYTITRSNHIDPLRRCASSENNYLDAASGELESVFSGIAEGLSPVRIVF